MSPQDIDLRRAFMQVTGNFEMEGPLDGCFLCRDTDPAGNSLNGHTHFFRHWYLARTLAKTLRDVIGNDAAPLRILAAPSSIGCEANGLAAMAIAGGLDQDAGFSIDAFDISPLFTRLARAKAYPGEMADILEPQWRRMLFPETSQALVPVLDTVGAHLNFLDAQPFETFRAQSHYHVAMVNNLFLYMNADQLAAAMETLRAVRPDMIVFGFDKGIGRESGVRVPGYVDIGAHPVWRDTALANDNLLRPRYGMWVRQPTV
ncbi:MAG: hypothetical protein H6865_02820 [Rhodospirillales bacterium]|nr:hypothetical protein [Alphaproteobacteria bacterium]MCB9986549.1 hypothetical protein [Rhodospirillales bacterium]USO06916.1 MAG: hypothetical protein H6866_05565 [Rhodospirillales bacterium]